MTATNIYFEVEGDDEHEHFAFRVLSETAPGVGDPVLYWIDMPGATYGAGERSPEEIARVDRMRRALFFVTARQFEVREMKPGQVLAYWQVTMRHATPEEAQQWGGECSNVQPAAPLQAAMLKADDCLVPVALLECIDKTKWRVRIEADCTMFGYKLRANDIYVAGDGQLLFAAARIP